MWFTYHSKLLGVPRPPLDASRYLKVLWTASEREEILRFKTAGFWPLSAFVGDLGLMLIAVNVMFHVCQDVFWTLANSGKYLPKDWPEGVGWTWPQQYLSNESADILVNLASHDLVFKRWTAWELQFSHKTSKHNRPSGQPALRRRKGRRCTQGLQ